MAEPLFSVGDKVALYTDIGTVVSVDGGSVSVDFPDGQPVAEIDEQDLVEFQHPTRRKAPKHAD